ncbi:MULTISPECIES: metalloregulator ArsR/SmtB family transcription factor [unclassified Pseudoxanthomonas]|jgi:ArsR family transcriptional regulator, virulence genes transcriptional regulator|uniref:ArsR/SmtB family transcription factor n=1 Tax=unclassified Pseudoxanthomonas TaxID=2645906 RepID=UPI001610B5FA|nr:MULTISPECIES: metalloregulator ArsR/SmtB family transcription factor [unclassified Pseudoxanthomonas]MBB3275829.1 DNA-binding transcriptional ArsR family regulator [Pseudoxanthomonas sp. OG2]MBV7473088.1 metalloregulator ArsR/SmtB family transcription factor [Pseudoxanthomonas sp. PXM05]
MPSSHDMQRMGRHAEDAAGLLKALAHPARLLVMCRIMENEASVSDLQGLTGLSMSALSQHLAVLREAGLVGNRRVAQSILYSPLPGPAFGVMQALYDAYCAPAARSPRARRAR